VIKNFNFYDIYGYFLPGLVLLVLIWLPFAFSGENFPTKDLTSAIAALALAYVVGNILQTVGGLLLQSRFRTTVSGNLKMRRFPSDSILDVGNKVFSEQFKESLAKKIQSCFEIDVRPPIDDEKPKLEEIESIGLFRKEAFLLCRSALIANKAAGYAEQFEGMYTLMRGLTTAFIFAALYFVGLASVARLPEYILAQHFWITMGVLILASGFAALHIYRVKPDLADTWVWMTNICLALVAFLVGSNVAGFPKVYEKVLPYTSLLYLLTAVAVFMSIKCYGSFKFFANEFAIAIYRDFYNYRSIVPLKEAGRDGKSAADDEGRDEE